MATSRKKRLVFIPVHGLLIEDDIRGELVINNVRFLAAKKLPYIRRRLGLEEPISAYQKRLKVIGGVFKDSETYALVVSRRDSNDRSLVFERKVVQKAIWTLASSMFSRCDRGRFIVSMRPMPSPKLYESGLFFSLMDGESYVKHERMIPVQEYKYGKQQAQYLKHHFFPELQALMQQSGGVKRKWYNSIIKAAELAGRSYLARSIYDAFMYDMIAIEVLLTERGDKYPEALIERINSLFGWYVKNDKNGWTAVVDKLYRLRCSYVHEGTGSQINGIDLYHADMLLANLLRNICKRPYRFRSKSDILKHAQLVNARRILGMPLYSKKDKFVFSRRHIASDDWTKVEKADWSWD